MSDEDNMALNVNEEEVADTTPVSEATEDVEEESTESTEGVEDAETETGDDKKKGYSSRIRELNARAKQAEQRASEYEEQVQSLSQRIAELTDSSSGLSEPYIPQVEPGTELTPEDYRRDVARTAETIVELRLKQQEATNRIKNDTIEAVRKHPELDVDSEAFDKDLSESVTEAVEAYIRQNPYKADVKSFVDRLMKPYKRAVTKEVGRVGEELAKQASQSAVKPTSVRSNEKPLEEKSIEELEKELGVQY